MKNETPTMPEVMKEMFRRYAMELRVMMPVRVEKYDSNKQKVDVQPTLRKQYKLNGTEAKNLPVITEVPVEWPVTADGKSYIVLPLKVGDTGKVVFADRSLDVWLSGEGEIVTPEDSRIHDLSDAVFQPGLRPFKKAISVDSEDNAYFANDKMIIEMFPDGKIKISGASEELIDVLVSAKVNTGIGPQEWLATTKLKLETFKV